MVKVIPPIDFVLNGERVTKVELHFKHTFRLEVLPAGIDEYYVSLNSTLPPFVTFDGYALHGRVDRSWKQDLGVFVHAAGLTADASITIVTEETEDELFFRSERMPQKVMQYLEMTGQPVVKEPCEIVRVILESLALRYRYSVDVLSELTGIRFSSMRVFGGGSKNSLLCQLMADTTGLTVHAGPAEASTIGNFIQQGLAQGVFTDRKQALKLIETHETTTYQPAADCEEKYRRALEICKWKTL